MPQIMIKGLEDFQVKTLAKNTSEKLSAIVDCPADWFLYDSAPAKFYSHTGEELKQAVIAVHWFQRSQDVQDAVASCIDNELKSLGFESTQISFSLFLKESYYEDGEHF